MWYDGVDVTLLDPNFESASGPSSGESGFLGKALLPADGKQVCNSLDRNASVIVNKNLMRLGKAEMFCHEAYGHVYMYLKSGGDRKASAHNGKSGVDGNKPLADHITKTRREAYLNMKNRKLVE